MQKEKRTNIKATLEVVGRDQPDQRLYLSKDQESLVWVLDHAENELWKQPPDPVLEAVAKSYLLTTGNGKAVPLSWPRRFKRIWR